MRRGKPKIDGAILMEASMRGPEHPNGPTLQVSFALVQEKEERLTTCGKVTFEALPAVDAWTPRLRETYLAFVDALEEHFVVEGGVFEEAKPTEVIHAVVAGTEPEEF